MMTATAGAGPPHRQRLSCLCETCLFVPRQHHLRYNLSLPRAVAHHPSHQARRHDLAGDVVEPGAAADEDDVTPVVSAGGPLEAAERPECLVRWRQGVEDGVVKLARRAAFDHARLAQAAPLDGGALGRVPVRQCRGSVGRRGITTSVGAAVQVVGLWVDGAEVEVAELELCDGHVGVGEAEFAAEGGGQGGKRGCRDRFGDLVWWCQGGGDGRVGEDDGGWG